jgi:hypothetical protein
LPADGAIVLQIDWQSHKELYSVLKGGKTSITDYTVSIHTFSVRFNTQIASHLLLLLLLLLLNTVIIDIISPRRYPYFDVAVGLVWSHDPKSYAGGSVCYW